MPHRRISLDARLLGLRPRRLLLDSGRVGCASASGLLWTPGYWGFAGGAYLWHAGYWGPHVGFYGGINYGFGYGGVGFWGGRWEGGAFRYNTAAWHVGAGFHGVYEDRTFINNATINNNHYSFNGEGGVHAEPTAEERTAMHEQHIGRTHGTALAPAIRPS